MNWDDFGAGVGAGFLGSILLVCIFGFFGAFDSHVPDQEALGKACVDRGGKWTAVGYSNGPVWSCLDTEGKVK